MNLRFGITILGRPKTYMTKNNKMQKKKEDKMVKMTQCMKAVSAYKSGQFKSMRKCSNFYNICNSTLRNLIKKDVQYQGSGNKLSCLTQQEEISIVAHIKWRASIGCGMDWRQNQILNAPLVMRTLARCQIRTL